MEKINDHCWATPKCGIITALTHFKNFRKPDVKFRFVIVRNPYRRMASFYISKVIEYGRSDVSKDNLPSHKRDWIPHIQNSAAKINCTFEEMVTFLPDPNGKVDRHLRLQVAGLTDPPPYIDRCENWVEDMREVCERLDIDHSKYGYVWENRSVVTDNFTGPKTDTPRDVQYVGDVSASWFRENTIPSDYSLFYNDQMKKMVRDLYRKDFDWLTDVYDDIETI